MPVIFKCTCGQYLSVPNKYSGKKLQCVVCQAIISVPIPSEETRKNNEFDNTPKVEDHSNNKADNVDENDRCKHCGAWITSSKLERCPLCGGEID